MLLRYALTLVLASWAFRGVCADQLQHLLDGVTCQVRMSHDGSTQDKDTLVFSDGTGVAPGLAKAYQFDPGPYTVTRSGQDAAFAFTLTSAEHGQVAFTGVITGATVTGKRVWTKNANKPIVFTFTGTVAKP
jgi:hypothetical protein